MSDEAEIKRLASEIDACLLRDNCGHESIEDCEAGLNALASLVRRLLEERDEARRAGVGALHDLDSAQERIASLEREVASYEGMDRAVTHYQEEVRRLERELEEAREWAELHAGCMSGADIEWFKKWDKAHPDEDEPHAPPWKK